MNKKFKDLRSQNYILQVKSSILFKVLSVASSFLLIPLMIHYLGQEKFGVWSTLFSVLTWMTFFDLGLGNGLRNKLAESVAKGHEGDSKSYISSAYSLVGIVSSALFFIFAISAFVAPWQRIFNTTLITSDELSWTVLITSFFVALNFWLSLINAVLNSLQKTSFVVLGQFLFNAVSLVLIYMLVQITDSSLIWLAITYGFSMTIVNLVVNIWFYRVNVNLTPRFLIDFSHISPLLTLGVQFFVIQIAALLIFATDKILITQLLGPEFVTSYDVVFKVFSIITLCHGLIMGPLWSSYTDAYHRLDFLWIKKTLKNQLYIFSLIVFAVSILIFTAKPLIKFWISDEFFVSMPLVISMGDSY
jgi:O-antigen/teichoic acid export membrane protein